jgi:aminopeptidase N
MPRRALFVVSSLATILGSVSCTTDDAPAPTDTGVPWELAELRRRTISELSYDVSLTIPSERAASVEGETTVRFRWDDPAARELVLDFLSPAARVRAVEANGQPAEWRAENDHVVVSASALRPDQVNQVRVVYAAGDESLNRSADFLYALFVPDRHHFSLPVFDQPNLKARWRLTLTVPEEWVAVSNGAEQGEAIADGANDASGPRTYRFAETRPIPSYLFSFAAGRFQIDEAERDGRRLRMFHRETDPARLARNREQIFDLHGRALAWLEEYTGIAYPFDKFDFVLVPAFQYGGMEHPGAILYRAEGMLLEESATQSDILGRASTISHETAHMWFGDLVTMNWFDDVWTKEVFANFMAAKIVNPSFPEVDHDLRFLVQHQPAAYSVDRTAGANAIRQTLPNLREAGTLYGAIIYDKAPVVMRQLEELVGADAFRDGMREYLQAFSYGNATWPDLIEILDRRAPADLEAWSHVWVEEPGRPTVRVERGEADGQAGGTRVTLRQEDPAGAGRVWPQRLEATFPGGEGLVTRAVELGEAPATIELPGGAPAWLLPNGGGLEYARFVLDDASREALLDSVGAVPVGRVRGAAWITLWDAVLEGQIDPTRFLEHVVAALPNENDEQVTQLLLGYVQNVYWRLLPSVERGRRGPGVELALWRGARESATPTLRGAYFSAWRGVVETADGVARVRRIWAGEETAPVPIAEPDRTRLAATLALREVDGWRQLLEQEEAQITNPDRKVRFGFVRPALSNDPTDRERFFQSLADPANREREPWVIEGLGYLNHPLRADHGRRFILPALELLEDIQRTGDIFFPGSWVDAALSGHTQPEAAQTVKDFLDARPDYPVQLRRKILQASDMVERSARIVHGWNATP